MGTGGPVSYTHLDVYKRQMNASLNKKLGNVKWGDYKMGELFQRVKTNKLPYKADELPNQPLEMCIRDRYYPPEDQSVSERKEPTAGKTGSDRPYLTKHTDNR